MTPSQHDYRFPNGVALFWIFVSPPCILLALMAWRVRLAIWEHKLPSRDLSTIIGVVIMCLAALTIATLITNSFPVVRSKTGGLEVRFYFPLLTRWLSLSWDNIDTVRAFVSPASALLRRSGTSALIVYSRRLPLFYYIPSLIFGRSLRRGFFISNSIKGYEILSGVFPVDKVEQS